MKKLEIYQWALILFAHDNMTVIFVLFMQMFKDAAGGAEAA